jgi:hypothetical protein
MLVASEPILQESSHLLPRQMLAAQFSRLPDPLNADDGAISECVVAHLSVSSQKSGMDPH